MTDDSGTPPINEPLDDAAPYADEPISEQPGTIFASSETAAPKRVGRTTLILVLVLLVAIGAGVGVMLAGGTQQQALDALIPSDVAVYASFAVHPHGDQATKLRALSERVPPAQRPTVDGVIARAFDGGLKDAGLDLTWQRDFAPWVGDRIAIAVSSGGSADAPDVVVVTPIKDEAKARATLATLGSTGQPLTYVLSGGTAYIAPRASFITTLRSRAQNATLSSNTTFRKARDRVGGEGLGFVWVNGSGLSSLARGSGRVPGPGAALFGQAFNDFAAALRAESNGLAIAAHGKLPPGLTPGSGSPTLVESISSGELGSLSFFDLGGLIDYFLKLASSAPGAQNVNGGVQVLQQVLGIDLRKDLIPWLHGEFSVVFGGLTAQGPNLGVLIRPTDRAALTRTLTALRTRLPQVAQNFGAHVSVSSTRGGFVIGTGTVPVYVLQAADRVVIGAPESYARSLLKAAASKLGDDTIYRSVVGGSSQKVSGQFYVRLDRLARLIEPFIPSDARNTYEANVKPLVGVVQAFGMRSTIDGDETDLRALFVFAKP